MTWTQASANRAAASLMGWKYLFAQYYTQEGSVRGTCRMPMYFQESQVVRAVKSEGAMEIAGWNPFEDLNDIALLVDSPAVQDWVSDAPPIENRETMLRGALAWAWIDGPAAALAALLDFMGLRVEQFDLSVHQADELGDRLISFEAKEDEDPDAYRRR